MEVRLEVAGHVDPEDATLAARVDGLQHGWEPDRLDRRAAFREVPDGRERGLRDALLGERPSHRDLVGHAVRDVASDRGKPEALRHRRDDRHGAVGGDRQRTVDLVPPRDLLDRVHVGEVDDLCHVGELEARGGGVPVDRDDAEPPVARLGDRAALMAARADEEDAWHGGMLVEGRVWNDRHGVGTESWPRCACCLVRLESVGRRSVAQESGRRTCPIQPGARDGSRGRR